MDNNGAAYYRTGSQSYYYPGNRTDNLYLDGAPKYRFPPIVNEISRPPTLAKPIDASAFESGDLSERFFKKTPGHTEKDPLYLQNVQNHIGFSGIQNVSYEPPDTFSMRSI